VLPHNPVEGIAIKASHEERIQKQASPPLIPLCVFLEEKAHRECYGHWFSRAWSAESNHFSDAVS